MKKAIWIIVAILVVSIGIFVYIKFFFVFGTGVKTGQLNYLVHKGYVFKTYEGKLIQQGLTSRTPGSLESNTFEFSVTDKAVAEKLMLAGGQEVQLEYEEYLGALPWRGHSKYVVNKIIAIRDAKETIYHGTITPE